MSIIEKALNKAKNEEKRLNSPIDFSNEVDTCSEELENSLNKQIPIINSASATKKEVHPIDQNIVNIDWKKLAELGFVTPDNTNLQTIDEYRNVKRPLVDNAFGANKAGIARPNLILVTSSVPGEGKTFTAINLALSIVNERDKKVLLIDADVARPSVARVLGIETSVGLIDYLDGNDVAFSDIVLPTSLPGLSLIVAGRQHKHSTELLSSNKMMILAEELSSKYPDRLVIFDSPPLLAATQADILAKLVGQVVLVIEAEKTVQSLIMESVDKLSSCDVVLAVLNKTNRNAVEGYYGYGYGHGYGYGQYAQS
ncbi:MAG: XrtA-associated tyrosine autokinase [Methylococcaceae bacterium]